MRTAIRLTILLLLGFIAGSVFIAEGSLHIWHKESPPGSAADSISKPNGAAWSDVQVTAADGAVLRGWLFIPRKANHAGVIALHGVGDTRLGMLGHVDFLLREGYTVLAPDCRGHGTSGGDLISFGIREVDDVRAWVDLLSRTPSIERIYGIGQSMGASILLESLPREPRFRAVVADCPFSDFREIAYERLAQQGLLGRMAAYPAVNFGFVYVRARYGVNLWDASPANALRGNHVPVLLIHGAADTNIDPRHSRALHAANPANTELWEVPGAAHVASLGASRQQYIRRVTAWFP